MDSYSEGQEVVGLRVLVHAAIGRQRRQPVGAGVAGSSATRVAHGFATANLQHLAREWAVLYMMT